MALNSPCSSLILKLLPPVPHAIPCEDYLFTMSRDATMAELLEIEGMLRDERLNDQDRHALHGAQQALRNVLVPET